MAKIKLSKEQFLELDNAEKQLIKRLQNIKLQNKGITNIEKLLLFWDQTNR